MTHHYYVEFNGATSGIDCGSDASLDNLASGKILFADGWVLTDTGVVCLCGKRSFWYLGSSAGKLAGFIEAGAGDVSSISVETIPTGRWVHVAMAYTDGVGGKAWLALQGVWCTYSTQNGRGAAALTDDSVANFLVGRRAAVFHDGDIAWVRLSDNLRYTPGVNFTPPDRCIPPTVDANTVEIWKFPEGAGNTTVATVVTPENDGAMTDCTWGETCIEDTSPGTTGNAGAAVQTYSLTLKPSVIATAATGSHASVNLTELAQEWKRSIRLQGGFWTGSFTLPVGKEAYDAFGSWLGCHIEERSAGHVTWEGMVYEMELAQDGVVRRRSFDTMFNRVRALYQNIQGVDSFTPWVDDQGSDDRYGSKEDVLRTDTTLSDVAVNLTNRHLQEHAWPYSQVVSFSPDDKLTVSCCGYIFTLNWQKTTEDHEIPNAGACGLGIDGLGIPYYYDVGMSLAPYMTSDAEPAGAPAHCTFWLNDNTALAYWGYLGDQNAVMGASNFVDCYQDQARTLPGWNLLIPGPVGFTTSLIRQGASQFIYDVVGTDSEFLTPGVVAGNYTQVDRLPFESTLSPIGCWDAIQQVVQMGDPAYLPWRIYAGVDRKVHFVPIPTTPRYFFRDDGWFCDAGGGSVNPWTLQPAVVRDMRYRFGALRSGMWLADPRDFLIEEFEVDWQGNVTPRPSGIDPTEAFAYQLKAKTAVEPPLYEKKEPKGGWWWVDENGNWQWHTEGVGPVPTNQPRPFNPYAPGY